MVRRGERRFEDDEVVATPGVGETAPDDDDDDDAANKCTDDNIDDNSVIF